MKRITSLLLILVITLAALSLVSCGEKRSDTVDIQDNMHTVYPGGAEFTQMSDTELASYATPDEILSVYTADDGGFVFVGVTDGYSGKIEVAVGINSNGEITGTMVLSHTDTPAKAEKVFDRTDGENGEYIGQTADSFSAVLVAKSTVTSEAYSRIVAAALDAFLKLTNA